jgi:small-conductance mechanosensitive channel
VKALTGREEPGPATGGEIAETRTELARVRRRGLLRMGIKIGVILLVSLLLPPVLTRILRWLFGGAAEDGSGLVFSALRAILKAAVWVTAAIMILSTFGVNVTAILAGLGIGGLAIGLAAQPMIADVLGAIVIVAERRFKIGDTIRLGSDDPARVIGLNWRSTQLKNAEGLVVTIPNRKVTEAAIQNLTRPGGTYDSLNVAVTTREEVAKVLAVIERALADCAHLAADRVVSVKEFTQKDETKTIRYRFSWFLPDYETRNQTRDEMFARISASLAHEDMAGTEISVA